MWNITNTNAPFAGQASRDDSREPVTDASDDKLSCLLQFASWVKLWQSKTVSSLSKETSTAVYQTSIVLVALAKHMITERNYKYVLLGQFQSDAIVSDREAVWMVSSVERCLLLRICPASPGS